MLCIAASDLRYVSFRWLPTRRHTNLCERCAMGGHRALQEFRIFRGRLIGGHRQPAPKRSWGMSLLQAQRMRVIVVHISNLARTLRIGCKMDRNYRLARSAQKRTIDNGRRGTWIVVAHSETNG